MLRKKICKISSFPPLSLKSILIEQCLSFIGHQKPQLETRQRRRKTEIIEYCALGMNRGDFFALLFFPRADGIKKLTINTISMQAFMLQQCLFFKTIFQAKNNDDDDVVAYLLHCFRPTLFKFNWIALGFCWLWEKQQQKKGIESETIARCNSLALENQMKCFDEPCYATNFQFFFFSFFSSVHIHCNFSGKRTMFSASLALIKRESIKTNFH